MLIIIIDNFLESCDVVKYREYVEKVGKTQSIITDEKMTGEFWEKYGDKIGGIGIILPYVTVTNSTKPVSRHKDGKLRGEKYKILIYLNGIEKNGGTIFYVNGGVERVQNKENRLVLFDMDIEHESEKFRGDGIVKKAIGFRVLGKMDQEE